MARVVALPCGFDVLRRFQEIHNEDSQCKNHDVDEDDRRNGLGGY